MSVGKDTVTVAVELIEPPISEFVARSRKLPASENCAFVVTRSVVFVAPGILVKVTPSNFCHWSVADSKVPEIKVPRSPTKRLRFCG